MKQSNLLIPDLQRMLGEEITEESQRFLVKSGFLGSFQDNQYVFLPLAMRVIENIKNIVTEELEKLSAVEFQLPVQSSLHAEEYLSTLLLKAPENLQNNTSMQLYQIQTALIANQKKAGHFLTNFESTYLDAFSFHETSVSLSENYHRYEQLFGRILARCDLQFQSVIALNKETNQQDTKEIIADSPEGDEHYCASSESDYRAKIEVATRLCSGKKSHASYLPLVKKTFAENIEEAQGQWLKSYFLRVGKQPIVLFLRQEDQLNLAKVTNFFKQKVVQVKPKEIEKYFGQAREMLDVWNLPQGVTYLGDLEVEFLTNTKMIAPHSEQEYYENINPLRDFPNVAFADFCFVKEGDPSPDGQGVLIFKKGVKIGQLYKKNQPLPEEEKTTIPFHIGHYQLDLSRLFLMIAQQHRTESGIIWPEEVAPFDLHLIPTDLTDSYQQELVEAVNAMMAEEFQILIDDRNLPLEEKQNEAAFIGCPIEITIGKKAVEGILEVKIRATEAVIEVRKEELVDTLNILFYSAE